ncbi:MAG: hypothetical protein ABSH44_08450 [Bryobacteraceae bacterium]|jgi:hypothetical protein
MKNAFPFERRLSLRLFCSALLVTLAFAPLGCKRQKAVVQPAGQAAPSMASTIHLGDPMNAAQLISGFYGIENNAWRWTARRFSLVLRPPLGAAQKGAFLHLQLTVPPVIIEKLKTISLSAAIHDATLAPETYTQPGDYTYTREITPELLAGESVRVDFQLDRSMPPSGADRRDLGVVVLSAGLELK